MPTRDAVIEALAARLALHARAMRHDVAEQVRASLRAAGVVGSHLDAGSVVGKLDPAVAGLGPAPPLADDPAVDLVDDDGAVLVVSSAFAAADHAHPAAGGAPAAHHTTHEPGGTDPMAVDAVAATGSLRTLGAGAQQASAGTHTHGAAAPAAHATTHQPGGSDAMAVDAAAATGSLRTLGTSATSASAGDHAHATLNELTNPGFEVWQRGALNFTVPQYTADRWQFGLGAGSSGTLTRESSIVDTGSKYSLKVVYTHTASSFVRQAVEDFAQLRGLSVTFSCRYYATANNAFRVLISDGVAATYSGYGTGDSTWRTLTLTKAMSASATACTIELTLDASVTLYVDNATLVVGSAALAYAPLHPADEMSRCQRYYHEVGGLANYDFACQGMAFSATSVGGLIRPHPVEMAVTPTMTVSSAAHWAVYTANGTITTLATLTGGSGLSRKAMQASGTVASGLVAGNATTLFTNNTTAARITFEASP